MATQSSKEIRNSKEIREKSLIRPSIKMAKKGLLKMPDLDQNLKKISRKEAHNSNNSGLFNTAENTFTDDFSY